MMDDFQNSPMVRQKTMANVSNMIAAMDLEMATQTLTLLESRLVVLRAVSSASEAKVHSEWLEREGKRMDAELAEIAKTQRAWREGLLCG